MANSGSLNTTAYSGRYLKLTWEITSQSIANNSSTISWTITGAGGSTTTWYRAGNFKCVINGSTVYSSSTRIELYNGTKVASGKITVKHGSDGKKTLTASLQAGIYTTAVNCKGSDSWSLTAIPRYANVTQKLNSKTETSVKINWSSDYTVDQLFYSTNNGSSWSSVTVSASKSGTYEISGLNANTTYKIKTRVRRKDTGLLSNSSALSVTTYNYPYCINNPNFVIGDTVKLDFYNPLNREFSIEIVTEGHNFNKGNISGTSWSGLNDEVSQNELYSAIPNSNSAVYQVQCGYNNIFQRTTGNNTFSTNPSNCSPIFNNFTYKDSNTAVTSITGNDQVLIKDISTLQVNISTDNKMIAVKNAIPKNYNVSVDTLNKTISYTDTDISSEIGIIKSAGTKRLNVRAYDSRNNSSLVYKDITIYDYIKPTINVTASRLNNFENQTTLKVSGTFAKLNIDNTAKNTIIDVSYRYREVGATEWSEWSNIDFVIDTTDSQSDTPTLDGKYSCTDTFLDLDNTKSFEFEILTVDKFSSNTGVTSINEGVPIFFISSNKKDCYILDQRILKDTTNVVVENEDLNNYTNTGYYFFNINAQNAPTNKGWLEVIASGVDNIKQIWLSNDDTYTRTYIDGTWSNWKKYIILDDLYSIGSIFITSTNENPSNKLGGIWELIDKTFIPNVYTVTSDITAINANISNAYIIRSGHTVRLRVNFQPTVELNDTKKDLFSIPLSILGFSGFSYNYFAQVTGSDGGQGNILIDFSADETKVVASCTDVNMKDGSSSMDKGSNIYFDIKVNMHHYNMLDELCNMFYWKRVE